MVCEKGSIWEVEITWGCTLSNGDGVGWGGVGGSLSHYTRRISYSGGGGIQLFVSLHRWGRGAHTFVGFFTVVLLKAEQVLCTHAVSWYSSLRT